MIEKSVTRKRSLQVVFAALTFLAAIVLVEILLSVASLTSLKVRQVLAPPGSRLIPATIPDKHLGVRPNPDYPEHDGKGFRNPSVPRTAYLVALGDSQTYGTGVPKDRAWPRQLESLLGKPVYGMACGGYGPTHSVFLIEEALAFQPQIVIEAFYAGNDLFDAFNMVYARNQLPELKTDDPDLAERIREAERRESLKALVSQTFRMGRTGDDMEEGGAADESKTAGSFISKHSKIYGLLRKARHTLQRASRSTKSPESQWRRAKDFAVSNSEYCEIYDDGQFRTIFTSPYRLNALNMEDPRIVEGLLISLKSINRMKQDAAARNIRFAVVLIPTKEKVFQSVRKDKSPAYDRLMMNEDAMWKKAREYFESNRIEYIDATPALRGVFAEGKQPYKVTHDGHPNEDGHRAIAHLLSEFFSAK